MAESKSLLEQRRLIKGKKPTFTRQESHRKKKLGDEWRKPRGMHSKMRLHQRGKKRSPETGWGSPEEVSGMHPSGLRPILVFAQSQVDSLKNGEGIILSGHLGMKKRAVIAEYAKKKGFTVLNIKVDEYLKEVSSKMQQRKSSKKKAKAVAAPKKEEAKDAKKEESKSPEEKTSDEEQRKKEKAEQDKVLTKKV